MTNVIEFRVDRTPAGSGDLHDLVSIHIDGRPLVEIMRVIESKMAAEEGHPHLAGGYHPWVKPDAAEAHYLGMHQEKWGKSQTRPPCLSANVAARVAGRYSAKLRSE